MALHPINARSRIQPFDCRKIGIDLIKKCLHHLYFSFQQNRNNSPTAKLRLEVKKINKPFFPTQHNENIPSCRRQSCHSPDTQNTSLF